MSNNSSHSNSPSKTSNTKDLSDNASSSGPTDALVTPSTKAEVNTNKSADMMDVSNIERDPRAHSHSLLSLDDSMESILHSPAPRTSTPIKKQGASRTSRKSQSLYKRALVNQAQTVQSPRQKEKDQGYSQSRSRSRSRSVRIPLDQSDSSNYYTAPESLNSTRATNEESYRSRDAMQRAIFRDLCADPVLDRLACTKPSVTDLSSMAKCVLITPLTVHTSQNVNVIAVTGQILITSQTLIRSSQASANINGLMHTLLTSAPAICNESNLADIDHENEKSTHKVFVGDDSVLIERVSTIHRGRDRNSFNTNDRRTYRFVCHGDLLANVPISQVKPRYLTVRAETSTSKDVNEIEKSERITLAFDRSSSTKTFDHSQTGISLVQVNSLPSKGPVEFDEHVRLSELSHINIVRKVNIHCNDLLWNEPRTECREQRVYKQQKSNDDDEFEPVKIVRSQSVTPSRGVNKKKNEFILGPLREKSSSIQKRPRPSVQIPRSLSADPSSRRRLPEKALPRSLSTGAMDSTRNRSSIDGSSRASRNDVQLQFPHKISSAEEDTSAGSSASSSEELRTPSAGSPKPEASVTTLTHDKHPMDDRTVHSLRTQNYPSPAPTKRDPVNESPVRTAVSADKKTTFSPSDHQLRSVRLSGQMMEKNASSIRTLPASGRVLKSTVSLTGMCDRESVVRSARRALSVDQMPIEHLPNPKAPSPHLPQLSVAKAKDDCDRTVHSLRTQNYPSPTPTKRDPVNESPVSTAVSADKTMTASPSTRERRSARSSRQAMQRNASSIRTLPASGRVLKSTVSLTGICNRESVVRSARRALSVDQMPLEHLQYPKAQSPPLPQLSVATATDHNSHRPVPRPRTTIGRSRVVPAAPPVSPADHLTPQKTTPTSAPPVPAPRSASRLPIHRTLQVTESKTMDKSTSQDPSRAQKRTNVEIVSNPEDYDQGEILIKKLTLETRINGHMWHLCVNFAIKHDRASEISFVPKRIRLDDKIFWEESESSSLPSEKRRKDENSSTH